MDKIIELGKLKNKIIEDCAQSVGSSYKNKKLGTIGDVVVLVFFLLRI